MIYLSFGCNGGFDCAFVVKLTRKRLPRSIFKAQKRCIEVISSQTSQIALSSTGGVGGSNARGGR
jgi:hypothetical protein